ncbi:ABC transporter substrate-binding protein [Streptomyces sp. RB6PN25]|uniref:ABC transporter substrate-binding protein n=1 Tax=Streptomyces humicola TaxID=2953240 RepID=A0ABT1Q018_9ACTN|nr:ABC transporter substrate-binding protein [Streptomyces humicola]MCQ4083254.1 ABC transporter substrate-binding protein [Streptomyces humicola]
MAALAAAALALSAACGTRLPASAFSGRPTATAPTAAPIKIGIVTSTTSPVGGSTFIGPRDGAEAYLAMVDAKGGVNGHPIQVITCDDGGSGVGNTSCVHKLIDQDGVFALVATTSLDYAGAPYVSSKGVPDVGGQPIGTAYDTYPHLYGIYGSDEPRQGTPGWGGTLYGGTEVYRYFKEALGARTAAVVYYDQADSARYAGQIMAGLRTEGYRVVPEQVDFALPNFPAVAADLRSHGVDLLLDAMDTHGNAQLCRAMQDAGVKVAAKVTNVQNWDSSVPSDYSDAPGCRNALWVTGSSRDYDDSSNAAVRAFRSGMAAYAAKNGGSPAGLSQWQLEGWAAAMWLTDAMSGCPSADSAGTGPARACVERFIQRPQPYDARGLLLPVSFSRAASPPRTARTCLSVARWQDSADGGRGGWLPQGPDMTRNCFTVPQLPYRP